VGRIHYDRHLYIGGLGPDIAEAYSKVPVRSALKPGGRAWFIGAGGPMGRMHVQRAIELEGGPKDVFCTALSSARISFVHSVYQDEAKAKGIVLTCVSREDEEAYGRALREVGASGFDDIIALAPAASALEEAAEYLAPEGVMNVFAGLGRGTTIDLDLSKVYLEGARIIGHSGSTLEDMLQTLGEVEAGRLSPGRSVAAVGSLNAVREGLQAVRDARFPGKVVIYPHIKDFPLTALSDLRHELPRVFGKLKNGREWTTEAEEQFLRELL
jgi:threonine dehydrogenase-like Zn-dependent dehydrogenase